MRYLSSHSSILFIAVFLITITGSGCTKDATKNTDATATSNQDKYISALEYLVSKQAESDRDKLSIMAIYKELGGSNASIQRAKESCKLLKSGKVVEELSLQQVNDVTKDLHLNVNRSLTDEEMKRLEYATKLYSAELDSAQIVMCPETKVEVKL
jgi:hypothetical protein